MRMIISTVYLYIDNMSTVYRKCIEISRYSFPRNMWRSNGKKSVLVEAKENRFTLLAVQPKSGYADHFTVVTFSDLNLE